MTQTGAGTALLDFGFTLKKFISLLILPPAGFIFWLILAALISTRRRVLGMSLLALGLVVFYATTLPVVSHSLQWPLEQAMPPWKPDSAAKAGLKPGAIVILGGGTVRGALEYGGETLKMYTLRRVRYGARVARQTGLPILVSGGKQEDFRYAEAELMSESLKTDFGLSARWIENRSMDTQDNGAYSVPILRAAGIDTVILVTDVDHMKRARYEFESRGIKVVPAATNYFATARFTYSSWLPSMSAFSQTSDLIYEGLGRIWQALLAVFHR